MSFIISMIKDMILVLYALIPICFCCILHHDFTEEISHDEMISIRNEQNANAIAIEIQNAITILFFDHLLLSPHSKYYINYQLHHCIALNRYFLSKHTINKGDKRYTRTKLDAFVTVYHFLDTKGWKFRN